MTPAIRAALYARVSTEEQAKEGFSITAQIDEIRKYCERNDFEIVSEYVDEGKSGKSISGRPQMQKLLTDASQHKFDILVIYKTDRLARKLKDVLEINDTLERKRVRLVSLSEQIDTTTPFGKASFQILGSFAELERNTIIGRVRMGMEQRAKEGRYNGGKTLGYDSVNKELVINENEAVIVRKIFEYADQGMGFKAITRRLNEEGYRSKTGKPFSTNSIKTILNNPMYIGKIRYNQVVDWAEKRRKGKNPDFLLVDALHDPLIPLELWNSVHNKLGERSYKPARSHQPYILSGLLKCPVCGHGMVPARSKGAKGQSYRYYTCGQFHNKGKTVCRSNSIRADVAEEQLLEELVRVASRPDIARQLADNINKLRLGAEAPLQAEKKAILDEMNNVGRKLQKLKDNLMNEPDLVPILKPELMKAHTQHEQLQENLEAIEAKIAEDNSTPVDATALHHLLMHIKDKLMAVDAEEQKVLLRLMVESIQITPEAPRGKGRQVKAIHLHFDFTIDRINHDSFNLLTRLAADESYNYIAPVEAWMLDSGNSLSGENRGDSIMESLSILPLKAIRFPPIYLHRAINLLHQHQPHELVRQRHAPEAQALLGAAQHLIGEPVAPSDHEHDMARPVGAEPVEFGGQLLRAPELAADGERDHVRALLHLREDAFALALLHDGHLRFA